MVKSYFFVVAQRWPLTRYSRVLQLGLGLLLCRGPTIYENIFSLDAAVLSFHPPASFFGFIVDINN